MLRNIQNEPPPNSWHSAQLGNDINDSLIVMFATEKKSSKNERMNVVNKSDADHKTVTRIKKKKTLLQNRDWLNQWT